MNSYQVDRWLKKEKKRKENRIMTYLNSCLCIKLVTAPTEKDPTVNKRCCDSNGCYSNITETSRDDQTEEPFSFASLLIQHEMTEYI